MIGIDKVIFGNDPKYGNFMGVCDMSDGRIRFFRPGNEERKSSGRTCMSEDVQKDVEYLNSKLESEIEFVDYSNTWRIP